MNTITEDQVSALVDRFHDSTEVFFIPVENLPALRDRMGKLARRAVKLGVPEPTLTEHARYTHVNEHDGFKFYTDVAIVTVDGPAPKYDGWFPVAVIDLDPDDAPGAHIVHVIGGNNGVEADPSWRAERDRCDHCTQTPKGRKKLVVVEHESGERKVVGTTCVRDFLGHHAPSAIASWFELLSSLSDLVGAYVGGGGGERRFDPEDFMAYTVAVIERHGWVPRSRSNGNATADVARDVVEVCTGLRRVSREEREHTIDTYTPTEAQSAAAFAAIEWARDLEDLSNDYLANIAAVANKAGWRYKDIGLGASIYQAYERAREREVQKAARFSEFSKSEHFGEVKQRLEISGRVFSTRFISSDYGWDSTLVTIVTDEGNVVKWFASNPPADLVTGARVSGKATIKKHDEYEGVKQTVINRPNFTISEG